MKISRLFNNLPKRLIAGAIVALAIALPAASFAADTVKLESSLGVANVTAGDTTFKPAVAASYDQVVKLQVYYHNTELPDSGKVAQNVRVKINIPTGSGTTQNVTSAVSADNASTINSTATINLNRADAYLQYIPGSAVWKHNTGSNTNINYVETKISDDVVSSGAGLRLEDEQPCFNFSATVTVLARVTVPGVTINKQVRLKGSTAWATSITANPGETVQYMISYKDTGNSDQNNVVIRDNLPPKVTYVPGTTMLKNTTNPNGVLYNSDAVTTNGINVGNYNPGGAAYVLFDAKLPSEDQLTCGANQFRNVGIAKPEGMNEYYNTADVNINKTCNETPKTPVYSCDLLTLTKGDNRTVTAKVNYTATNGATLKTVKYNFGEGEKSVITTDKTSQSYTYGADGNYAVTATLTFTVKDATVTGVTSQSCSQNVTFTTTTPPVVTPPTTPTVLPNTGAGNVIGLFAGAVVAGTIGYRLFLSRRLSR
jgi:uncharacterized repeat protein (TIGR01451 family)